MAVQTNTIEGTAGPDNLQGDGGSTTSDYIIAGDGDDVVQAGSGRDDVEGGGGDDYINGGTGRDRLYGEEGDDTLFGGAGNDRLFGGAGSDTLRGGQGNDDLYGDRRNTGDGSEADYFVFDDDDGNDKVYDFVTGQDEVHLVDSTAYSLNYVNGNTIMTYGDTTVKFIGEIIVDADITYI